VIFEWCVHIMAESATDSTAVENAYRDIDRFVSETREPSSNGAKLLSPSERLRLLGKQQQELPTARPAAQETATPLLANKF
jgi:hypothetical protein